MSRVVRWCGVIIAGAITGRGGLQATIPPGRLLMGSNQWQTLMVIGVLLQTMLWGEALEEESVPDGHRKGAEITADQCGLMESN